jgi:hypothetical protein
VLTIGHVEAGELDGLRVVDHGREVGVNVGRGARVLVTGHQRRRLLLRQAALHRHVMATISSRCTFVAVVNLTLANHYTKLTRSTQQYEAKNSLRLRSMNAVHARFRRYDVK